MTFDRLRELGYNILANLAEQRYIEKPLAAASGYPGRLDYAFRWSSTPENHSFWSNINREKFDEAKNMRPDLFDETETTQNEVYSVQPNGLFVK